MRTGQARANMFEARSARLPSEHMASGSSMVIAPGTRMLTSAPMSSRIIAILPT
jgi:hypothetical protein